MSKRQRRAAFIASAATPVECPTKYGETRSLKSPMAARALSIDSPSRNVCGFGSLASVSSQADAASIAKNPAASSARAATTSGSNACPARRRTTDAA